MAVKRKRKGALKAKRALKRANKRPVTASRKKAVKKKLSKLAVPKRFNLLVTHEPNHRGIAEAELDAILKQINEIPKIELTGVDGLLKVAVKNSRAATKKISVLVGKSPASFIVTCRYIPIDTWTASKVATMRAAVKRAAVGISQHEKWKMALQKRHWDMMDSAQLIIKLTEPVEKPNVDLNSPAKIIQVEIIGGKAGIALLKPDEIVDVPKLKAEL